MLTILGVVTVGVCYVALMNYLGGERHLFFNQIRAITKTIKNIR